MGSHGGSQRGSDLRCQNSSDVSATWRRKKRPRLGQTLESALVFAHIDPALGSARGSSLVLQVPAATSSYTGAPRVLRSGTVDVLVADSNLASALQHLRRRHERSSCDDRIPRTRDSLPHHATSARPDPNLGHPRITDLAPGSEAATRGLTGLPAMEGPGTTGFVERRPSCKDNLRVALFSSAREVHHSRAVASGRRRGNGRVPRGGTGFLHRPTVPHHYRQ